MNSIRTWLNGSRDYTVGATLYSVHGDDNAMKRMFAQGPSAYRQERLVTALKALLSKAEVVEIVLPDKPEPIQLTIAPEDMPETRVKAEEDPYRDKWYPEFTRMNLLRHRLAGAGSIEERGRMAFEILELERHCKAWWARRDYLLKNGVAMPEEEAPARAPMVDHNRLEKRLRTVYTYVTKYANICEEKQQDPATHPLLQQYIKERNSIEKQLGKEIAR